MPDLWIPIRIPLGSKSYLQDVILYLVRAQEGYLLLDAGLNTQKAFRTLEDKFRKIGIKLQEIRGIYITHYHLDHCGLATRLQELLSIDIHMTREDKEIIDYFKIHMNEYPEHVEKLFSSFGVSNSTTNFLKKELERVKALLLGPDKVKPTFEGEKIELETGYLEVISTPGHTPGHISFFLPHKKILLGGDFLLRDELPHVGIYPQTINYNPLKEYLDSLEKVRSMEIDVLFPSHGEPIYEPKQRIDDVISFIRDKIEDVYKQLKKSPLTLSQICDQCFHTYQSGPSLSYYFLLTLTLAYLRYLEEENLIEKRSSKSSVVFVA